MLPLDPSLKSLLLKREIACLYGGICVIVRFVRGWSNLGGVAGRLGGQAPQPPLPVGCYRPDDASFLDPVYRKL